MADFVERMVARLRERGLSRNRHFIALSSPEGKRALRIHRHLRSIERDLRAGAQAALDRSEERFCLTLKQKGSVRISYLTESELRILCTSPLVRAALGAAAEEV